MVVFSQAIPASTPTRILPRNPQRAVYTILNFSGYDFYLSDNQDVLDSGPNMGIKVVNGSAYEDEYSKAEVWIYGTTAGTVTVQEVVKEG